MSQKPPRGGASWSLQGEASKAGLGIDPDLAKWGAAQALLEDSGDRNLLGEGSGDSRRGQEAGKTIS